MMKASRINNKGLLNSITVMLALLVFLPLSFAFPTHINVAVDTSEVCDYSNLKINIGLHYPYDAVKAKLKIYIDGKYKTTIYIQRNDRLSTYITLDKLVNGEHDLSVKYYIYNGNGINNYLVDSGAVSVPFYIYCNSPPHSNYYEPIYHDVNPKVRNILLYASKHDVMVGDVIRIYGYVDADEEVRVKLYLNYRYIGSILTSNGYFEKYIRIEKEGHNLIEVRAEDKTRSTDVYAEKVPNEDSSPEESGNHTIEIDENNGDVNIIIHNGNVRIYYGKNSKEEEQNVEYEYVDVQVSTKQLDMEEGKGNLIKVKVLNHMNESKLFLVNTSINEKYVYLPSPKVLKVKEQGEFDIYLKPSIHEEGSNRINAVIYIYMNNKEIKRIPIEIFIIKKKYKEKKNSWELLNINLDFYKIATFALLLLLILNLSYILLHRKQKEEPLKPHYYGGLEGRDTYPLN